jgi:hypothetical protein
MNSTDEGATPKQEETSLPSKLLLDGSVGDVVEGEFNNCVQQQQQQRDNDKDKEDTTTTFQHIQKLLLQYSDGLLTATISPSTGVSVVATSTIDAGTKILTCPAEAFALDPSFRSSHCGFCTASASTSSSGILSPDCCTADNNSRDTTDTKNEHDDDDDDDDEKQMYLRMCPYCRVIGFCQSCHKQYYRYHRANECNVLQRLVTVSALGEDETALTTIDSSILLTVRLLCCRTNKMIAHGSATKHNNKHDDNNATGPHRCTQSEPTSSFSWRNFQCLYELPMSDLGGLDEALVDVCSSSPPPPPSIVYHKDDIQSTLGRVLGCSHAIVDQSLPLGRQTLGRAVFVPHSFYNHSCSPNAFLSTVCGRNNNNNNDDDVMTNIGSTETPSSDVKSHPSSLLIGRVYTTCDVRKGDPVTLSYIPLSGLSIQERQTRLQQGYAFVCNCDLCADSSGSSISNSQRDIILPVDADVDSIRVIQFSCNERLLNLLDEQKSHKSFNLGGTERKRKMFMADMKDGCDLDNDKNDYECNKEEVESVVSIIQMTRRGIQNQGLPSCHEVSIEADRLLAMACKMLDNPVHSRRHHQQFLKKVSQIRGIFDPVAEATQRIDYANVIERQDERILEWDKGIALLTKCLGIDHPWLRTLLAVEKDSRTPTANEEAKRLRM